MSDKDQRITAKTTAGAVVEISLEDWANVLIEKALTQHKMECPVYSMNDTQKTNLNSLDKRLDALEIKLRIVQWLTAPLYIGLIAWLIKAITSLIEVRVAP